MKRGQVWIETVLYTLIGLALIGIVLALVTPRVTEARDRIVVEQSIEALSVFDDKILEALDWGPGNARIVEFSMRRGELFIDPERDQIRMVISELKKPYSEPGVLIDYGRVQLLTEEGQKTYSVVLTLDYFGVSDLTYEEGVLPKQFSSATIPYQFLVHNQGNPLDGAPVALDIQERRGA